MYRALVDGRLSKAVKDQFGICPHCDSKMIARCGDLKIDHWAHKSKKDCDDWYTGKETEWHFNWKELISLDFSEKRIIKDEAFHIADIHIPQIKGDKELFIEFQNSPISIEDVKKREEFYGDNLIWVLNGLDFGKKIWIDRKFIDEFFNYWMFNLKYTFDSQYYSENDILDMCAYHIDVPMKMLNTSNRQFLLDQGFKEDERYKEWKHQISNPDSFVITYHKHMPRLRQEGMDAFLQGFKEESERAFYSYVKEQRVVQVRYEWKYAKRGFEESKQPIFIDLNENELLQIDNLYFKNGLGKLIKKDYFIKRIKKKIALRDEEYLSSENQMP